MRRRITIRFIALALIALTAFLILRSSSIRQQTVPKGSGKECCQKKCKVPDNNYMIWETFSRQFISATIW
ncbi:MAG TPA: hypothetical protein VGQ09_10855 [Chitinophagaceae bacterium]|nr:hypothetical protein [Chitinophagaceae bacterium]